MFRFTIRDLLWLMLVVGFGLQLGVERTNFQKERRLWNEERETLRRQHDRDLANEQRLATLRAREMAGQLLIGPRPQKNVPLKLDLFKVPISR